MGSYEGESASGFMLDDGSRFPARKSITGASYDPVSRLFRGSVVWAPSAFQGHERWELALRFSEDLAVLEEQNATVLAQGGQHLGTLTAADLLPRARSLPPTVRSRLPSVELFV